MTLNEKSEFSKKSVKFLGQILDESGVHADPENLRAITHMSEPTNTSEVKDERRKQCLSKAKTLPLRDLL